MGRLDSPASCAAGAAAVGPVDQPWLNPLRRLLGRASAGEFARLLSFVAKAAASVDPGQALTTGAGRNKHYATLNFSFFASWISAKT